MSVEAAAAARTRTLHLKRSFGKYPRMIESPAYDASEEDNDPLTDDGSALSPPLAARAAHPPRSKPLPPSAAKMKHHLAASVLSDSDGVDSPTYDGDVESSTAGRRTDPQAHAMHTHHYSSSTSTLSTRLAPEERPPHSPVQEHRTPVLDPPSRSPVPAAAPAEPAVPAVVEAEFNPAALTPEDIQEFMQKVVEGEPWRTYKINPPPTDRPIRIYADGVYDLFHFGHALQLRQAKLSFPFVHLMVGVNSDEQVRKHKGRTVMTHTERLEAVRHCRWVDEVLPEAPWVIGEDFLNKYEIDYVAHDEDPYLSDGHDDVYGFCKALGKFIPTRRTPGVSTSELLERIVSKYRQRDFDEKLTKMGHAELRAEGSDYDDLSGSSHMGSPIRAKAFLPRVSSGAISPFPSPMGSRSESPTR